MCVNVENKDKFALTDDILTYNRCYKTVIVSSVKHNFHYIQDQVAILNFFSFNTYRTIHASIAWCDLSLPLLFAFSLWVVTRCIFSYIFSTCSVIYCMAVFASTWIMKNWIIITITFIRKIDHLCGIKIKETSYLPTFLSPIKQKCKKGRHC
jgi:hypothetical protein